MTGVQTCALPISSHGVPVAALDGSRTYDFTGIGEAFMHIGGGSYRSGEENRRQIEAARAFVESRLA